MEGTLSVITEEIVDSPPANGMWERIVGKSTPDDKRFVEKVSKTDLEFNRNASVDRAWDYLEAGGNDSSRGFGLGTGMYKVGAFALSIGLGLGMVLGRLIFGC